MNVGALLVLFLVAVAAVVGVVYIGSHSPATTPKDTFDRASSADANSSYALAGNLTATGTQVGSGAILLIAFVILLVVIGALVFIASRKF